MAEVQVTNALKSVGKEQKLNFQMDANENQAKYLFWVSSLSTEGVSAYC